MAMRICTAFLLLAVAGCSSTTTSTPDQGSTKPAPQPITREEVQERQRTAVEERVRVHTELAASYLSIGNFAVAIEEANIALKVNREHAPAYNVLGLVYMQLRDDALAESNFTQALRYAPNDSDTLNNYGSFLCQRKREDEAIKMFLAALRNPLYRTPERSWLNAGICAAQRNDFASADEFFQQALKIQPDNARALYELANLAYRRGDFVGARTHLNRLARNAKPNAEVLWLAVRTERQLGDREAEASYGLQLRRNFPDSKEAQALAAGRYE
jgi:type IV pilus assembly protein PilF